MVWLASNSVACRWLLPAGRMLSVSILVLRRTSATSSFWSSRMSINPACDFRPSVRSTEGRATSASTSKTVWSSSIAMLMARLIAVKVLPSPGNALVTMIRLLRLTGRPSLEKAFPINGRLIARNSSATGLRPPSSLTMLLAPSRPRSISTRLTGARGMSLPASAPGAFDSAGVAATLTTGSATLTGSAARTASAAASGTAGAALTWTCASSAATAARAAPLAFAWSSLLTAFSIMLTPSPQ